ncbi:MAG: polyisoprenyl-phosphate glycosyltransferase [Patescibacteria group bacterium]|nr:polyisoprenyl-phosphate glycosyltransferase [Patescibacteria group bacterium]MDQ5958579.1 polyisoprenyl-phosphate glycosyltransferase [Patescibacteria group bacterium]
MIISVVVPVYNEQNSLQQFNDKLLDFISNQKDEYRIIYVNDGSTDDTYAVLKKIVSDNKLVSLVSLSRNFGKEIALSAGIYYAQGDAVITLDGDGQHPVSYIPNFISKWQKGAAVVIGVRKNHGGSSFKKLASGIFYKLFNAFSDVKLVPYSTDFRLIDKNVRAEFIKMQETNRINRGLIDWLGYSRDYVYFEPNLRHAGVAKYSFAKLIKLASDSFVSLTPVPLYIFGFIGIIITPLALLLGLFIIFEQYILGDPLLLDFTGTAMLGVLIIFLVGMVLMSQGIIGLYLSHIQAQSANRPLFVIDYSKSTIDKDAK